MAGKAVDPNTRNVKLSIILPTHNRADVIAFAIRSVLYQSFQDYELLIVGDGCTDQTVQVVKEFDDPRIQWLDLPKAPYFGYANRNIAFKEAKGDYIGFMAHDDIILPDHFELLVSHLEDNPQLELAYSRPGWVTRDGYIFGIEFNLLNQSTRIAFLQRRHNALPASCVVHRKSCFEKYGYWNADLPVVGIGICGSESFPVEVGIILIFYQK
ncbi:MAG: glycosyltransferase family 2 protein [Saprospiraceae bacterium]|nr:glycosyltransferase family 2 protein [Saprospiraceae bacterium]